MDALKNVTDGLPTTFWWKNHLSNNISYFKQSCLETESALKKSQFRQQWSRYQKILLAVIGSRCSFIQRNILETFHISKLCIKYADKTIMQSFASRKKGERMKDMNIWFLQQLFLWCRPPFTRGRHCRSGWAAELMHDKCSAALLAE